MIFIFLDGTGIGEPSTSNPFYNSNCDYLPFFGKEISLPDGTPVKPIDPLMGVEGIPQSATGQTTIYTGNNIPKIIGSHMGSFPNKAMRKIIKETNIFKGLKNRGLNPMFLNSYPNHSDLFYKTNVNIKDNGEFIFSENFPRSFKRRISATSCLLITNEMKPFDLDDISNKKSIYQEYSNKTLNQFGANLPEYSPETAAEIIFSSSKNYDFLLYEYFQTDLYGHRKSIDDCNKLVFDLNRLVKKLISLLDNKQDTLIITSDHGNIENPASKTHTLNPVPLITWGHKSELLRNKINNLADITPAIYDYFISDIQKIKKSMQN